MIDITKMVSVARMTAGVANKSNYNADVFVCHDGGIIVEFHAWDDKAKCGAGFGKAHILPHYDRERAKKEVLIAYAATVDEEKAYYAKKQEEDDIANELDYLRSRNKQLEEEIRMLQGR